jgi:hypothetical protein
MRRANLVQADALRRAAGIQGSLLGHSEHARRECIIAGWIDGATGGLTAEGHRAMVRFAETYGSGTADSDDLVGSPGCVTTRSVRRVTSWARYSDAHIHVGADGSSAAGLVPG